MCRIPHNQAANKIEICVLSKAYLFIGLCLDKLKKKIAG